MGVLPSDFFISLSVTKSLANKSACRKRRNNRTSQPTILVYKETVEWERS
jgi:hypothetical protein